VISPSQQPLADTQHSQEKNIKTLGRIRTSKLSQGSAADPCLWRRGRWNQLIGYAAFAVTKKQSRL